MAPGNKERRPLGLEEQVRDLLRRANLTIMAPPDAAPADEPAAAEPPRADPLDGIRRFSLKPRDVRDYLDRFVIRQDEAKKVLAVAICDHYNHVRRCLEDPAAAEADYAKHNVLLLGPTGVGKTYLMRCIARLIGVPFVKADATKFSETGYVGRDVEDLPRDLVKAAGGNVDLAEYGIIYLDEIDKIAAAPQAAGRDVSGRGVQVNLLKLMEETEVSLFSQTDIIGQMQAVFDLQRGRPPGRRTLSTRHMLFIVSGVFDRLAEQVRRRVDAAPIGFGGERPGAKGDADYLRLAQTRDLVDHGFEPEFVGRLPVRVVCDELSAEDLEAVVARSEGSILSQYKADFAGYGIRLDADAGAIREIARRAHAEKTGARGLMTVLERVFRDFKFEMPSLGIGALHADEALVRDPPAALARLAAEGEQGRRESCRRDARRFAADFERLHGIRIAFGAGALERLVDLCLEAGRPAAAFCAERLRDLEYAAKLVCRNTGRTGFTLTRKAVDQPAEELSRLVARSFRRG